MRAVVYISNTELKLGVVIGKCICFCSAFFLGGDAGVRAPLSIL
jgi:hypothetical protein